ncbi:hypothetical protein [Nitrosomonas ureae]|uniref:hypothetical protein n=1 Tax=Nitrosomonas ureae TaxID=44577 RepID=UPI0021AD389B|nr:hypothetical protein [Nitrosomonas ureae]
MEIEAVDAGTTDNPGRVLIKETQTTIKYDIHNNQISSTTSYTRKRKDTSTLYLTLLCKP